MKKSRSLRDKLDVLIENHAHFFFLCMLGGDDSEDCFCTEMSNCIIKEIYYAIKHKLTEKIVC